MFAYIIWRIRIWLGYDEFHLTPEMKARMKTSSLGFRYGSWFGVLSIGLAGIIYVQGEVLERYALRAPGKIIRAEKAEGWKPAPPFQPVYRYTLPGGKTYEANAGFWPPSIEFQAGDGITVLYWEARPGDGTIEGINSGIAKDVALNGLFILVFFRLFAKLLINETVARIFWCLVLKLP